MDQHSKLLITLGLVIVIAATYYVPLINIWALNTLFGLTIPYTLKTWAAMLVLTATVFVRRSGK